MNNRWNIIESSKLESEIILEELFEFNNIQAPFTQKTAGINKNYVFNTLEFPNISMRYYLRKTFIY